ncbi:MAG: bifunctional folylpolyglutamate synthase/dihydrofolate synthase, partial [Mailhella sp.]|nr:bifunctional folylpolyglutamate synthase/dihydrofolate synthase [Mailhella sp.]
PEERISLDSRFLPRRVWPALASQADCARKGLTYFELITVMAALAYRSSDCGIVILEAGLGGRYDATTAIHADMTVFTPIGLDHVNVLGDTLQAIADDKSDVLRTGVACAGSAPPPREAAEVILRKASERGIPLCMRGIDGSLGGTSAGIGLLDSLPEELRSLAGVAETCRLGLHGPHQRVNAGTAVLAWLLLCHAYGWKTDAQCIARGLRDAFMPGRLQFVPASPEAPAFWLDGAPPAHGMAARAAALAAMPLHIRPAAAVFSCLSDKCPEQLTAMLRNAVKDIPVFVPTIPDNPRAASGSDLAAMIGKDAAAAPSVADALRLAAEASHGRPVLVCGSLYLLSAFYELNPSALHY